MNQSEVAIALDGLAVGCGFASSPTRKHTVGGPDGRTPKQVVAELRIRKGDYILMPDGVSRCIRKINSNGEVFVEGLRNCVNVYAVRKDD